MKKTIGLLTVFFIGAMSYAQQQTVVAVQSFELRSGISELNAHYIVDTFVKKLQTRPIVNVVLHSSLQSFTTDIELRIGNFSNDRESAAFGKNMHADCVVRGNIKKIDAYIFVNASLFDVHTLEVIGNANMLLNKVNEAAEKMDAFIAELFKKIMVNNTNKKVHKKEAINNDVAVLDELIEKIEQMTDAEFFFYLGNLAEMESQNNRMPSVEGTTSASPSH
ncbi:MAG: hypothetical protein LBT01_08760 [Spirochaetaceae bacterium]|jgi:TolB-like protein|nr:hypothetical protein [Spirochaetaceae bacterium]